jgi:hypothetical protein
VITGRNTRLLAQRLRSQLLSGPPATDPVAVARRLLAVQAQIPAPSGSLCARAAWD